MKQRGLNSTQIVSLVVMVVAIVVGWIAYHNYQPKLLEKYHLTEFSYFLTVAQAIILIVTPPLAGLMGDRMRQRGQHRFGIIALGVGFAAMIFMTVALGLATFPPELIKTVLPILVVFWLVAMNIFTSPAISTFELFAPFERQPLALAILTVTAELLYALEPIIVDIIDALGGVVTFAAGGVLVVVAGLLLRRATRGVADPYEEADDVERTDWGQVVLAGARLGVPTALIFSLWPTLLEQQLAPVVSGVSGAGLVSAMLGLAAITCIPLGQYAQRWGIQASQRYGFTAMLLASVLMIGNVHWALTVLAMAVFALSLSLQSVSALPYALSRIAARQKVLGVGVFFAGVEIPCALLEVYLAG